MKNHQWVYMYLLLVPTLFVGTAFFAKYHTNKLEITSKFKAGDCIQFQTDLERWERPMSILLVLEIGKKSYRIARFIEEGERSGWYAGSLETMSFSTSYQYKKVDCPNVPFENWEQ